MFFMKKRNKLLPFKNANSREIIEYKNVTVQIKEAREN
jgi:hypothetical protein